MARSAAQPHARPRTLELDRWVHPHETAPHEALRLLVGQAARAAQRTACRPRRRLCSTRDRAAVVGPRRVLAGAGSLLTAAPVSRTGPAATVRRLASDRALAPPDATENRSRSGHFQVRRAPRRTEPEDVGFAPAIDPRELVDLVQEGARACAQLEPHKRCDIQRGLPA